MNHFIYCMERYWVSYKDLMLQQARERLELEHRYKVELAMAGEAAPAQPTIENAARIAQVSIDAAAGRLMQELLTHAIKAFSPNPATPLALASDELLERLGYLANRGAFQPADLWGALAAKYGNGIGPVLAYQARAKVIGDYFRLSVGSDVPTKNGRMALTRVIYALDRTFGGAARLTHDESQILRHEFLPALVSLMNWAEKPRLAKDLEQLAPRFSYPAEVNSRESFILGDSEEGRIKLVTYQTSFEWTFEPAVAERLALFLGEFYFTPLQAAA